MRRSSGRVLSLGLVALLVTAASGSQQPKTTQPPGKTAQQHQPPADAKTSDMAAKCKAMMANHDKMMNDMKAADQRLDSLVTKMNSATSSQGKVDATAAAVTELVAQRKAMRDSMMQMHQGMMGHMGEHMQAGKESMAMCPMMKGMSGKH